MVRTPLIVGWCVLSAVIGAGIGHARMDNDLAALRSPKPTASSLPPCPTEDSPGPCHWDAQTQGNGQGTSFDAPYCMFDAEVPAHVTVAGPADGWVTVDGKGYKALTWITGDYADEVQPDAGPFDGILYNVPGPGTIAVDGYECEPT